MSTTYVPYWEKLKDPRWQKRRLEIMERDGFQCRCCRSKEKTLNVHHAFYEKGRDPWDYPEHLLRTFCQDCHERWHVIQNLILGICAQGGLEQFEEVLGVVKARYSGMREFTTGNANFPLHTINEIYGAASQFFAQIPFGIFLNAPTPQTTDDIRAKAAETFPNSFYTRLGDG